MDQSDFFIESNAFGILAGENLAQRDLGIVEELTGKTWKATDAVNAAVGTVTLGTAQTNEATGRIVAQTSVIAAQTLAYSRQAVVKDTDGNIITLTSRASGQGAMLNKYTSAGRLIFSLDLDVTATASYNHHLLLLGNGNIAAIWVTGTTLKRHVLNTTAYAAGTVTTTIDTLQSVYFSAIALSGGGFAIAYQPSSVPLTTAMVTYDNNGTAVLASTAIWTRTGTSGNQYHKMIQLDNGNIALAVVSNNTVSGIGLYVGVVSTAGAIVAAFTSLNATAQTHFAEMSKMTSNFAVAYLDGTNHSVYVFNNSAVQQGSTVAYATNAIGLNKHKLFNDGTDFIALFAYLTAAIMTKVTTGGVKRQERSIGLSSSVQDFYLDGFYERGFFVGAGMSGAAAAAPIFFVVDVAQLQAIGGLVTTFGTAPATTNGSYIRLISGGDFAFVALYDYANVNATNLCVGKYSNTAIVGPVQTAVTAGNQGKALVAKGSYRINRLTGSAGKAFNHKSNAVAGVDGVMGQYGIIIN